TAGLSAFSKDEVIKLTGVNAQEFEKFYTLFAKAASIAVIFGTGISASDKSMASLLDLCILKGIQKSGVIMPTALQSNAVGVMSVFPEAVSPENVLKDTNVSGLFIYEDDPFHYLSAKSVEGSLKAKTFKVVCDMFPTDTTAYADVVIPTGSFAQKTGSYMAEDGFSRVVCRGEGGSSSGFQFLRLLLERLGGGLYKDEAEASLPLSGKEMFAVDEAGKLTVKPFGGEARFAVNGKVEPDKEAKPFTLVLRNVFFHHHLAGKGIYSKMIYLNNPAIAGNKLFISPDDAAALGITDGGTVIVESSQGAIQHPAVIKEGLGKGIVEYRMLKDRQNILKLADGYSKHIAVTVKKG
ncbi:MAG: molybdopterin dinucleotide binding domain-containing protein, partial [Syntrophorhabdus sp.]